MGLDYYRKNLDYEHTTVGEHETVSYDRAILFKYEKGQILVSAGKSGPGMFEVQYKPEVIREILNTLSLRKELMDEVALKLAWTEKAKLQSA